MRCSSRVELDSRLLRKVGRSEELAGVGEVALQAWLQARLKFEGDYRYGISSGYNTDSEERNDRLSLIFHTSTRTSRSAADAQSEQLPPV